MKKRGSLFKYILLLAYLFFIITPFIWTFYSSFRREGNLFSGTFFANTGGLTISNYLRVFRAGPTGQFATYFTNSLIIATISTIIIVILAVFGAYSISRFRLPFKEGIILSLLLTNMFPLVLLIIPIFGLLFSLSLIDTYAGIIFTHIILGLPFGLWLVKGYFDSVPKELDEAAMMDGLGPFGTLIRVILPVTAPGVVVAAFYAFMVSWGDFLFVSIISQSLRTQTLTIGLNSFFGSTQVQWGSINAATIITIIPTILIFAFLQKWIVEGLTSGAVKG